MLTGTACENSTSIHSNTVEPDNVERLEPGVTANHFNSQPEPSAHIFSIEILELREGSWEGTYMNDEHNGRITIETHSSVIRGKTLHQVQTWTLHPPDPVHPPDPIQPIQIMMNGHLNVANSRMIMNGKSAEDEWMMPRGTNAHLRAMISESTDGLMIAGGELMFNPQPEPPARSSSDI
ncbi:hypothetical protein DYD21_18640 [Rhodohalobacter sp. SW132]|nr:hypothetical protein DYD21_18640 [Rhodohalobacter sp. SW132]